MVAEMPAEKLHAACDECRLRKLKCSGEAPTCSRCEREKISCVYSPQKPMGRPRKRRRDEAATSEQSAESFNESSNTSGSFPMPHFADFGFTNPPNINDFAGLLDPSNNVNNGLMVSALHADTALMSPFGVGPVGAMDPNLDLIDPSLWGTGTPTIGPATSDQPGGPCTCLSIMYLTLSDLQAMTSFAFPAVIPRLRQATSTASSIIHCQKCPTETFTAIQNVQSLSALLSAIAERFHRVLTGIDEETTRLIEAGEKKPFRVGDNSPENMHLHTGTLDCPMGFDIKLDPKDWQRLAKQALRTEVLGGGCNKRPLISIVEEMEKRQRKWHTDVNMHSEERAKLFGAAHTCRANGEDAPCLQMLSQVRRMVEHMEWE